MTLVDNAQIARAFDELADLLELDGENPFKLRAYRNFAETVRERVEPLATIVARGELTEMDGVGKAIAAKVEQMLETGTFDALERAREKGAITLLDLLNPPGFGAKTVRAVWQGANVTTLEELVVAGEAGTIASLPGIGKKKENRAVLAARELLEGAGTTLLFSAIEACAAVARRLDQVGAAGVVASRGRRGGL